MFAEETPIYITRVNNFCCDGVMGKRSKQYALRQRESQRRAKCIARRKEEAYSVHEEDKMLNAQSSKHSFQEEKTLREDPDEAQSLEELRAKYVRLR